MIEIATPPTASATRRKWKMFAIGLGVRLIGVLLIWLGDGSEHWYRKAIVIVGVILTVGGIGILRYMLLNEPLSRLTKRKPQVAAIDAASKQSLP